MVEWAEAATLLFISESPSFDLLLNKNVPPSIVKTVKNQGDKAACQNRARSLLKEKFKKGFLVIHWK